MLQSAANVLAQLERACFEGGGWSAADLASALAAAKTVALLAEAESDTIVSWHALEPRSLPAVPGGYALLREIEPGLAEVLRIGVLPEFRRRGLAGSLLRSALAGNDIFTTRPTNFLLEVAAGNTAAVALYRQFGFAQIHVRKAYYANGEDALIFRTNL